MKFYAVIDTNVLVSALLKWDSVPGNVVELALRGIVKTVVNDLILEEYRAVLSRKQFHFTEDIVDPVIKRIESQALFVNATAETVKLPDPKDQVFYEVVMEGRRAEEAYLVTGNMKHFPSEPFIVTPRQFLDLVFAE